MHQQLLRAAEGGSSHPGMDLTAAQSQTLSTIDNQRFGLVLPTIVSGNSSFSYYSSGQLVVKPISGHLAEVSSIQVAPVIHQCRETCHHQTKELDVLPTKFIETKSVQF